MEIERTIIVEGRDDTAAVLRAVAGHTIETHGFGISAATWSLIHKAHQTPGLIVFTDPDYAGEQIRRRILSQYPDAGQAWLPRADATRGGDIGIENASPEAIREALAAFRTQGPKAPPEFTAEDLFAAGLAGGAGSSDLREALGRRLGIGGGNSKAFLRKLNAFHITRKEFNEALHALGNP